MIYVNVLSILKPILFLMTSICFSHIVHWKPRQSYQILILENHTNNSKLTSCPIMSTKTELIIFHSSSKKTDHSLKFILDGKRLIQTDTVKYLGVLLDDHLLWSKQINHVATKLNQAIGILSKLRSRASLKILKIAHHSLSCFHLLCGSQHWVNHI